MSDRDFFDPSDPHRFSDFPSSTLYLAFGPRCRTGLRLYRCALPRRGRRALRTSRPVGVLVLIFIRTEVGDPMMSTVADGDLWRTRTYPERALGSCKGSCDVHRLAGVPTRAQTRPEPRNRPQVD